MHVVVIGGGSGLFQAIKAVRPIAQRISVIVPTCGNDGADALIRSVGRYRGAGRVVNVLLQMSRDAATQRLMQQQFPPLRNSVRSNSVWRDAIAGECSEPSDRFLTH
jgi:2-phospho-L-lactate transferase/gluconeogenesis factor (CofD/UPF0052 family)